jgi:uncharacterized damage-inducible protein DinB
MAQPDDNDERRALLDTLEYQRASVRSIVNELDEQAWHTSVVPSGWTPAGMVEHLGHVERHWFQGVVAGSDPPLPWDEGRPAYDPEAAFVCDRTSSEIVAYYRQQCDRSDEILATTPFSAAPRGTHDDSNGEDEPTSVRWVILHVIEETAAHSGHLEIARELLDGRRDLGLR